MKRYCKVLFFLFVVGLSASAQNPYKKRVVSYIGNVLVASKATLTANQLRHIAEEVEHATSLPRFTYAPLPDTIVRSFGEEVGALKDVTPQTVRPLVETKLAPRLLEFLDMNKELLSKRNLTDVERNTFLATKAKAAGLSATQLEAILNSGYLYFPFVELYERDVSEGEREVKNEKGEVTKKIKTVEYSHKLKLGVLWYKLNVSRSNRATISYLAMSEGWGMFGAISRSLTKDKDSQENADGKAFDEAVSISCQNIELKTKQIEAFKLTGEVTETTSLGVKVNLGKQEGVGLDDTYWIEEMEENEKGDIIKNRRGFAKIRNVQVSTSDAQTITGSNYSPGLSVSEVPLLGLNAVVGWSRFPISIGSYNRQGTPNTFFGPKDSYNFYLSLDAQEPTANALTLGLQTDLAKATGVSELWFHIGGSLGSAAVSASMVKLSYAANGTLVKVDTLPTPLSVAGSVSVGLLKKFYLHRFGFFLEAEGSYTFLRLEATGTETYVAVNEKYGAVLRGGLEVYLAPTFSVGGAAEMNFFSTSDVWATAVSAGGENKLKNGVNVGPDTRFSGISFSVWINYSLPSLF